MAIYKVILYQSLQGQLMQDELLMRVNEGTNTAQIVANDVVDDVIPAIKTVQNSTLTYTRVTAVNLADDSDFEDRTLTPVIAGDDAGDCMPAFVAWGFRKNRNQINMRHGSIRFAGVTESLVQDGVATAGAVTELNTLANFFTDGFTGTSENQYSFGYIGKPLGSSMPVEVFGTTWAFTKVTSQVSRKPGHGN